MAEEKTLIIEVDLACATCCTKIQKVLCKIKEKWNIKSISYDAKKNEITIIGTFDPHKLYLKLRCKVGCCIKGHKIPEKKKDEPKKEKKEEPKVAATANATVNLQYAQVCVKCYPWPCRDPTSHGCQPRHNEGVTCGVAPNWNTCVGPPRCGGCGSCGGGGGGWCPPPQPICCPEPSRCGGCGSCGRWPPQPTRCPGPSCRGCNGCRVVHEQKYEYHEYPPNACVVM